MSTTTTNYNLVKPLVTENYDIDIPNGNMDIIDSQMKTNADDISDVAGDIGDKTLLDTTDKTDLVSAVNEVAGDIGTVSESLSGHLADTAHKAGKIYAYKNLGGGL